MKNIKLAVYRNLQSLRKFILNKQFRKFVLEVNADYYQTRKVVGKWGKKGSSKVQHDQYFAILSFTRVPLYAKFHSFIGKILQLKGYTPIIITQRGNRIAFKFYRLLGINQFILWDEFEKNNVDSSLVDKILIELLPVELDINSITQVKYRNVQVGKHAMSMVCRTRLEGQLNFNDREVFEQFKSYLRKAISSTLAAEILFEKYPVKKMLVRDSGYIPHGAIFESGLFKSIDCIVHEFGLRKGTWVFKRHRPENLGEYHLSLSNSTWNSIKSQEFTMAMERELNEEFEDRYKPASLNDTRRLQYGKTLKTPDEVIKQLGLDPSKKTAVIFSHIAWDAAFFFGSCIFGDFESWLFETVKFVIQNGSNLNWIVKLHPYNAFKLQRETKDEESEMRLLRPLFPLPEHVKIMRADTDINTQSLFPLVDYVLTVNGTVGMEFPCFGIPAVVAGTGRYDHRGFTIDAHSKEEYFEILSRLHTVPRLDEKSQSLAKIHYYYLITKRQTLLEDALPMELKRFHEAQSELHNNVSFTAKSLDEFLNHKSVKKLAHWFSESNEYDIL